MQTHRFHLKHTALALAFATFATGSALAQTQPEGALPEEIPEHYYRAELVILERMMDPALVEEKMAGKQVEPPVSSDTNLWVEGENNTRSTDLELVDTSELHLNQAVQRLERSGNYQVLAAAGWYQDFPPDYDSGPMRVTMGDWLEAADQREVDGYISIERRRYLHVGVHLNHWQVTEEALQEAQAQTEANAADTGPTRDMATGTPAGQSQPTEDNPAQPNPTTVPADSAMPVNPELVTWIRETRRMRSGEIHFIDSPTIGVLVYFEPIEQTEQEEE